MAEAITRFEYSAPSFIETSVKRKVVFSKSWTVEDDSERSSEANGGENGSLLLEGIGQSSLSGSPALSKQSRKVVFSKSWTVEDDSERSGEANGGENGSLLLEGSGQSSLSGSPTPLKQSKEVVFSKSWTVNDVGSNASSTLERSEDESSGNLQLMGNGASSAQPKSEVLKVPEEDLMPKRKESLKVVSAFASFIENANTKLQNFTRYSFRTASFTGQSDFMMPNEFSGEVLEVLERVLGRFCEFNQLFCDPKLDQQISLTRKKMVNNTIIIGVFGRLKSGKSTILNSITSSKLFPTDAANPETSIVVGVCHENNVHIGPCSDNLYHGRGKRCPRLINERGKIIAEGTGGIVKFLERCNKDARRHGDAQKQLLVVANIPALARCNYTGKKIIIQDTPGLGEAYNEHIMDMTEISFHPCSAFMYIVDCSKLKDQLDVNALTLIRNKDSDIFKDGRLLTIANHFDKTLQKQVKKCDRPVNIIESVKEMIHKGVYRQIPTRYIIPCVAYWAWSVRLPDEADEDDFEYWMKKYTKYTNAPRPVSEMETPQEFIEKASGITMVEEWITNIGENGEALFLRSLLSDVLYCAGMCMERCFQYGEHARTQAEEMGIEMTSKASIWNDAVGIIAYVENELESLPDQLNAAYDLDVQAPCRYAEDIAQRELEQFKNECHRKCQAMSNGINDDEYYSDSDDENDEWFGIGESELVQSSIACGLSSMTLDDLDELGKANVSDPNAYHLSEFKDDLRSFIQDLEQQLNAYLATALRFTHVQQAIPLQDFKDHKATMDLCAFVFLVGKPSADIGVKISKFDGPTNSEIEAILADEPLTLNQLRSKAKISELKLSWPTRLIQWFKRKFSNQGTNTNPSVTKKDVTSAIKCLLKSNCLEECSNYVTSGIKEKIVKCYFEEYTTFVKSTLDEYESNALVEMERKSKEMENEMASLLKRYRSSRNVHDYLVRCMSSLEWEKQKYTLNMEGFKRE